MAEVMETTQAGSVMAELTIESSVKPCVLDFNYIELKKVLEQRLKDYEHLIVTDDSLDGCKNAKKELVSFRTGLENFRKEKKSEAEKPIKEFDRHVKELEDMVVKVEKPLDKSLDVYAELVRQKKKAFAEKHIAAAEETYGLRRKFADRLVLKKEFLNVSVTQKSVRADIIAQAETLKREQDEYDKNIAVIRETVESENAKILVKLAADDFVSEFEDGADVLDVLRKIKKQADNIFAQEKKMETERLEKERQEEERLAREKLEEERLAAAEKNVASTEEDILAQPQCQTGYSYGMPADTGCYMDLSGFDDEDSIPPAMPKADADEATQEQNIPCPSETASDRKTSEKSFEVIFRVKGKFSTLKQLNDFIKDHGIVYETLSQKQIYGEAVE